MSDSWSERLSDYLDGELEAQAATAVEAHLEECPRCREDLEGLRRVVRLLDGAQDRAPRRDLWPQLARRLPRGAAPHAADASRPVASLRGLRLAAGLAGVALLAGLVWTWLADRPGTDSRSGKTNARTSSVEAGDRYEDAGGAWRDLLAERALPSEIDPIRAEMAAFERAIDETRRALAADPADDDLRAYLTQTLRARVRFMSRVEAWTEGES